MKLLFSLYGIGIISAFIFLKQEKTFEESIASGKELYADFCTNCHLPDGKGVEGVYPPLAGSDYLLQNRKAAIHAVKYGQSGEITVNGTTYNNFMAPLGLTDEEVADVMNYILNSWSNTAEEQVTLSEVSQIKN